MNRHCASFLVTLLTASHPDGRVQYSAYVQGPSSLRFLRLIVERVVCEKKMNIKENSEYNEYRIYLRYGTVADESIPTLVRTCFWNIYLKGRTCPYGQLRGLATFLNFDYWL